MTIITIINDNDNNDNDKNDENGVASAAPEESPVHQGCET